MSTTGEYHLVVLIICGTMVYESEIAIQVL